MSEGTNGWRTPFPALTRSQRWHLEVNGYVVVEGVFGEAEVVRMRDALLDLKAESLAQEDGAKMYDTPSHMNMWYSQRGSGEILALLEAHPSFL